ncbi:MAG: permease prefix domain 1-containing protein [Pirellulales bacterium]
MPDQPPPNPPHDPPPLASSTTADSLAPQTPSNLDADITDELTDHLSLSARDLQLAGHAPDEAHQIAHQKFGDIATIRRRLWWILKGDVLMLRAALAVVLVVLVLAVAALGIGGWQISQTMNKLRETLAEISAAQKASLPHSRQSDRGLSIQGRLYIGERSKPASFSEVHLYHLPDLKLVERLSADQDGRFATAPLPPGQYFVIAPLVGESNPIVAQREPLDRAALFVAQSAPINVYPWSAGTNVEMDLKMFPTGELSFELTRNVMFNITPKAADQSKRGGVVRSFETVLFLVIPNDGARLPEPNVWKSDLKWPLIGAYNYMHTATQAYRAADIERQRILLGEPTDFDRLHGPQNAPIFQAGTYQAGAHLRIFELTAYGAPSRGKSRMPEQIFAELPADQKVTFEMVANRRAHLRVTPPDGFEEQARAALDESFEDDEKLQALLDRVWPVKVEFLGQHEISQRD